MENKFEKYSDDILMKIAQETDDEEFPFALLELAIRKHPKTVEFCIFQINRTIKYEKKIKSFGNTNSSLDTLYYFDKNQAISFFKEHYKRYNN